MSFKFLTQEQITEASSDSCCASLPCIKIISNSESSSLEKDQVKVTLKAYDDKLIMVEENSKS